MNNLVYVVHSSFGSYEDKSKRISGIFTDILLAEQLKEEIEEKYKILKESGEPGDITEDMIANMTQEQIEEYNNSWDLYFESSEYNTSWIEPIELNTKLM